MAVEIITTEVKELTCENGECGHVWRTLATTLPIICPKCRSRQWNGKKQVGRPPSVAVPLTIPRPRKAKR